MEEKINRLLSWIKGKKVGPLSVEIWPTNRCNLRCIMCGTWASRRKAEERGIIYDPKLERERELSEETWIKIVEEAISLGVKEFLITGGGEPLVRKETTLKLMEEIKRFNAYGMLNTNGTLFSLQDVKKVVSLGWDLIIFSIDGPDEKTHDSIRNVPKTFTKVKRILLSFKKEKKKLKTDKPKIAFNTVVLNKNFEKFLQLIKFASFVGCEDITFIPLITFDKLVEKYKLTPMQKSKFSKMIHKIEKISKEFGIHTNIHEFKEKSVIGTSRMDEAILSEIKSLPKGFTSTPCYEPFLHFLITPDGMASCCCMLADKGIKADFAINKLRDIWFGDWFNSLREQFLEKKLPLECGNCVFSQYVRNREIREELRKILD